MDFFAVVRIISLVMKVSNAINQYSSINQLETLKLLENIKEVEEVGYTVIPPEKVASEEQRKNILNTILKIAEKKNWECFRSQ